MKRIARIVFIIMLMLSAAVTFVYIGAIKGDDPAKRDSVINGKNDADADRRKLVIAGGNIALQTGQSHQCAAEFETGESAKGVQWSSTDENIAKIDADGRVTGIKAGKAELWAVLGRNLKARVTVSVYDDIRAAARNSIISLAADGTEDSLKLVESLTRELSEAMDGESVNIAKVMKALTDFKKLGASGDGDAGQLWESLGKAADDAGMTFEPQILKRAALSAFCHGERASSDLTLSFAGDCTFAYFNESDRRGGFPSVYRNSGSVTYPFDLTRCVFGADDISMINFEGALTDSRSHKQKQFYFRGEPSYINILTGSSVEAVTLENNHSFDYFDTGFNDTTDIMREAGIKYSTYDYPAITDSSFCRAVMLSLSIVGVGYTDEFREHTEYLINRYKSDDTLIVVNVHWGNENDDIPEKYQIEAAHAMIDAGADLVIGHHPHVLQGIELYNGHYIVYSLGNFSFGGNSSASSPYTVIFRVSYERTGSGELKLKKASIVPCFTTSSGNSVNNYQPVPLFGSDGEATVKRLLRLSSHLGGGVESLNWSMIP